MTNMRHKVAGFLVLGLLFTLVLGAFNAVKDGYGFTEEYPVNDGVNNQNIFEQLDDVQLIQGINKLTASFSSIVAPSNILDLLGAMASAGVGILQTLAGVVIFPPQLFAIIALYYHIPGIIGTFLGALLVLYVGFVILSTLTRTDL